MKGFIFRDAMTNAWIALNRLNSKEPTVVVREGRDGQEIPVSGVKMRRGVIVIEYGVTP